MGSLDQCRRLKVRGKARNVFVLSLRLSDHKVLHSIASSSSFFFDFARIFSLFSLVFRTSNFWSLRNLIKQLFHSRLLDMRLVIDAPRWLFTILYLTRAHVITIVNYFLIFPSKEVTRNMHHNQGAFSI